MNPRLVIKKPVVVCEGNSYKLVSAIVYPKECSKGGGEYPIWLSVEKEYAQYLTPERSDGFLLAVLQCAMAERFDIVCEAPVEKYLLYQLREYLIPALVKGDSRLYAPDIICEPDETVLPNAGAIGTGMSCGVDSLRVIRNGIKTGFSEVKPTHLVVANVGAFYKRAQFDYQVAKAGEFANEYGYKIVVIDSNFTYSYHWRLPHLQAYIYCNALFIFALQKLWKTYLHASGLNFCTFSLNNTLVEGCATYDLLTAYVLTTPSLKFYIDGGAYSRFDKIGQLTDFEPAQKYLNVCLADAGDNCNLCHKCARTMLILDAYKKLDKFEKVFDVKNYRHRRLKYVWKMISDEYGMLNGKRIERGSDNYRILEAHLPLIMVKGVQILVRLHSIYSPFGRLLSIIGHFLIHKIKGDTFSTYYLFNIPIYRHIKKSLKHSRCAT